MPFEFAELPREGNVLVDAHVHIAQQQDQVFMPSVAQRCQRPGVQRLLRVHAADFRTQAE